MFYRNIRNYVIVFKCASETRMAVIYTRHYTSIYSRELKASRNGLHSSLRHYWGKSFRIKKTRVFLTAKPAIRVTKKKKLGQSLAASRVHKWLVSSVNRCSMVCGFHRPSGFYTKAQKRTVRIWWSLRERFRPSNISWRNVIVDKSSVTKCTVPLETFAVSICCNEKLYNENSV